MASAVEVLRFDNPDEVLDMKSAGAIAIVNTSFGGRGMRANFEPGWTWEKDEKPLLGSPDACPMHHTGYCLKGTLVVRMAEAGDETRIVAGDFFEIPPGHDGYVEGDESVELILFAAAGLETLN
jgi:mannose-6-phosphate isomerase-like protein (cupin superfamily)